MARLGDVCTKGTSNIAQKDLEGHGGNYPIYGASGFIANVDFYQQENPYIAVVKDGAGIGRIMKLPAKSSVIGTMQYIIPNDTVDISYLAYAMEHMNLSKYFTGATIPHIYFKDYQKEELPLPSLDEQRKIAAVLDKVSDLIAKRRQQLDKLDLLIKARFVEMFDLSACTYGMLSDNTEFVDYRGHTPTLSDDGNIRMVNAKSVGKGVFKYVEEYVTEKTYDSEMHRGFGYPSDVLFVTEGHTFGNACQVPQELTKFALGQRVITIQGHRGIINNAFLCAYMQTDKFIKDIAMYKTGGTAQGIRSKDLGKVKVPLYPYGQQETFEKFVDQTEKTKTTISRSLEKLETLKKALMQECFG